MYFDVSVKKTLKRKNPSSDFLLNFKSQDFMIKFMIMLSIKIYNCAMHINGNR